MTEREILYISLIAASLMLTFFIRFFVKRKKDNMYDYEKLSRGEFPKQGDGDNSFPDKTGSGMNIRNFKETCLEAEKMIKAGQRDEAVSYIVEKTGILRTKAENIVKMSEKRYRK